jgi:hypothetical protein
MPSPKPPRLTLRSKLLKKNTLVGFRVPVDDGELSVFVLYGDLGIPLGRLRTVLVEHPPELLHLALVPFRLLVPNPRNVQLLIALGLALVLYIVIVLIFPRIQPHVQRDLGGLGNAFVP